MKNTLFPVILASLAVPALSHGVTFLANGNIVDDGETVGTFSVTGATPFDTPTGAMFQGQLNNTTVSFSVLTLDPDYEITGPLTIGSTNLVSGEINDGPDGSNATTSASSDRAGFAIGAIGTSPIFEFNVPGTFDLGTYAAPTDDFSNTITATTVDGAFTSGSSLAADTPITLGFVDGEYTVDTFLFTPDTALALGDTVSVSVSGIGGDDDPGGESFVINVPIEQVPEPTSAALLGLGGLALLARRRR